CPWHGVGKQLHCRARGSCGAGPKFEIIRFRRRRTMQKTIVAAAAVLFTGIGVCLAQPPGITREMIARALPLEGAPKAEPGPYQVVSEPAFDTPGLQVYRP